MSVALAVASEPGYALTSVRTPVLVALTSRRAVDLCRVGSCLCRCA